MGLFTTAKFMVVFIGAIATIFGLVQQVIVLKSSIQSLEIQVQDLKVKNDDLKKSSQSMYESFKSADKIIVFDSLHTAEESELEEIQYNSSIVMLLPFFLSFSIIAFYVGLELKKARDKAGMEVSLTEVLSYRIDYYLSLYSLSKPIALMIATFSLVMTGGIIYFMISDDNASLANSLWTVWLFIVDTGAHADQKTYMQRMVGLLMTIAGMVVFGFMIGIVTDIISEKVDQLKKGRSRVIEKGHTLILNWSDKTLPVINEICNANESAGGGTIVVLAEREKEAMENEINDAHMDLRGTIVVVRSGSPLLLADLRKASASTARAIIVLADKSLGTDESDAMALRIVLSLNGLELFGHIVVELNDIDNRELVMLVGKENVETVTSHDMIGRMMIQCARAPGLSLVLDNLLGFDGSEFYLQSWKQLCGTKFEDIVYYFPAAVPIGIRKVIDGQVNIKLNPPGDTVLEEQDELIVLAEDDDSYSPQIPPKEVLDSYKKHNSISQLPAKSILVEKRPPEKLLFVGWRRDIDDMIFELDKVVEKGSELTLFSQLPVRNRLKSLDDGGLNIKNLKNLRLRHAEGNPVLRRHLERIKIETFDSVLILADENLEVDVRKMDSRSLASLLLIRDIHSQRSLGHKYSVDITLPPDTRNASNGSLSSPSPSSTASMSGSKSATLVEEEHTDLHLYPLSKSLSSSYLESKTTARGDDSKIKLNNGDKNVEISNVPSKKYSRKKDAKKDKEKKEEKKEEKKDEKKNKSKKSEKEKKEKNKEAGGKNTKENEENEKRTEKKVQNHYQNNSEGNDDDINGENGDFSYIIEERKTDDSNDSTDLNYTDLSKSPSISITRAVQNGSNGEKLTTENEGNDRSKHSFFSTPEFAKEIRNRSVTNSIKRRTTIISEILDPTTKTLISSGKVSDYVASNELVSKAIAMIAERKEVSLILGELLTAEGNETYIRHARLYCRNDEELNFFELTGRARVRNELLIGYKFAGSSEVFLNPIDKHVKRRWKPQDQFIVFSEQ